MWYRFILRGSFGTWWWETGYNTCSRVTSISIMNYNILIPFVRLSAPRIQLPASSSTSQFFSFPWNENDPITSNLHYPFYNLYATTYDLWLILLFMMILIWSYSQCNTNSWVRRLSIHWKTSMILFEEREWFRKDFHNVF